MSTFTENNQNFINVTQLSFSKKLMDEFLLIANKFGAQPKPASNPSFQRFSDSTWFSKKWIKKPLIKKLNYFMALLCHINFLPNSLKC